MGSAGSWYGDAALKREVLAHLDADHAAGAVSLLQVRGRSAKYWDMVPEDADAMRAAVGIPTSVLAFGLANGGLIESPASARWVVDQVRSFLGSVPVGAHVAWVVDELAARRLVDVEVGVIALVEDYDIPVLLERVARALREGLMEPSLAEEAQALLSEWSAQIPKQWKAVGRVDPRVYAHCRALTTALEACAVPTDDHALGRVVHASLHHGIVLPWSTGSLEQVREEFRGLLREAEASG
ncbi:MAG: hypothetical protein JJ863_25080 [Deltaproteobacteria bacterium]|nr:hypothetical protein [Deltaproteobacteria bacterium]